MLLESQAWLIIKIEQGKQRIVQLKLKTEKKCPKLSIHVIMLLSAEKDKQEFKKGL